jgi:hemerythrin superfamily protein
LATCHFTTINTEHTMTTKPNQPQDAIALLEADHREVKAMFTQFEELSDRARASKKKLTDQICTALEVHTQIEEEIFYPAVREASSDLEDIVDESLVEHASAKELIAQLQEMDPEDELYDAKVKVLGEQIDHHVGEEEGEMFPKVRKLKLDLAALGQEMAARKDELAAAA